MLWVTGWYPKKRLQTAQKQTLTSKHSVVERKCHVQTIICNESMFILEHIIYPHDSGNSYFTKNVFSFTISGTEMSFVHVFFFLVEQSTWTTCQRLKDSEISLDDLSKAQGFRDFTTRDSEVTYRLSVLGLNHHDLNLPKCRTERSFTTIGATKIGASCCDLKLF